jgi:hypothetical protein
MQLWKWFSKEDEEAPEVDELKSAVEESKAALEKSILDAAQAKSRADNLLNVSQGALDILTNIQRKSNG